MRSVLQGARVLVVGLVLAAGVGASEERQSDPVRASNGRAPDGLVSLPLGEAVQQALREGFPTRIAGLETDQARELALEVLGAYLPQLGVSAQAGWSNRINEKMIAGDGKVYGLDNLGNEPWVDVFVQQALLDLPLWQRIKRENLGTELAELAELEVREAVAYEVLRVYSSVARLESLREAGAAHHHRLVALSEWAENLWDAGRILETERATIAVARDDAALAIESLDLELARLRGELRLALGDEDGTTPLLRTVPSSLPLAESTRFPEGLDQVVLKTPGVRILELRREIEGASVSVVAAERWPTLVLRGGYSNYGIKRFDEFEDEGYIFMGMEVPLFDGLQNKHAVGGAQKALDIARLRYRSGVSAMRSRLLGLNRKLELLGRRLALAERRVESTAARSQVADVNLEARRGGLGDALTARERLLADTTAAVDLRFAQLEVWARLHRELGRLVSDLGGDAAVRP